MSGEARTDDGLLLLAPERGVGEAERVPEANNWVALFRKGCEGQRVQR